MRRFTHLTNVFSKKGENHMHAVALHFMYYNFVKVHQTLKVTPAMQAALADRLGILLIWSRLWMQMSLPPKSLVPTGPAKKIIQSDPLPD